MNRWRLRAIVLLFLLPVAVLVMAGGVALWHSGYYYWLWWLMPLCWALGWWLARASRKALQLPPGPEFRPAAHFTERDKEAWNLIALREQGSREITNDQLTDPHFYLQTALDMAHEMARLYHPMTRDPFGSLTVSETLSAAQLALEDTALWIDENVPGSHLVTIDQWRGLSHAPMWWRRFSNATWLLSVLGNPLNLGRYVASKFVSDAAGGLLVERAKSWFYIVFLRNIGLYLIELNSGRLKGGVVRYRRLRSDVAGETSGEAAETVIALVGQVKAGKSSVVNALLGSRAAAVDVLPQTKHVARYTLSLAGSADKLVLLDTAGYHDSAATASEKEETRAAARQAHVLLLVMDATSPARDVDKKMLADLDAWFAARPQHKRPAMLGVLTHIDGLRPVLEWQPPYDWRTGESEKAKNIAASVAYAMECFGDRLTAVVPVCSDVACNRASGIQEELLPALVSLLDEGRACSLLRALDAELSRDQAQKLIRQLKKAALGGLGVLLGRKW